MDLLKGSLYVLRQIALFRNNAHIAFLYYAPYRTQYYTLGGEYERYKRYCEKLYYKGGRNNPISFTANERGLRILQDGEVIPYYFFSYIFQNADKSCGVSRITSTYRLVDNYTYIFYEDNTKMKESFDYVLDYILTHSEWRDWGLGIKGLIILRLPPFNQHMKNILCAYVKQKCCCETMLSLL